MTRTTDSRPRMAAIYAPGTVRARRWHGEGDVRGYRPPPGWTARADLTDEHELHRYDALTAGVAPFTERINRFRRQRRVLRQFVEYSLAVREDLSPTQFYSGDAFYRGVVDAAYLYDDEHLAVVDHKTGRRVPGTSMRDQLEGYLVLSAAWWKSARTFWLGLHWVAERAVEWSPPVAAAEIADRLAPSVLDNIEAAALAIDDGPRTTPGPWCDRCAYRSLCPASQERWEPVYFDDDVDTALFDRFVAEIVPAGAPDPTRLSEDAGPAAPGALPTAP